MPKPNPADRIPSTNEIHQFLHCELCLKSLPVGITPREWAVLEIGFTPAGLQIWCRRHDSNVGHIDFQGHQHPANLRRLEKQDGKENLH
jgi:hypothetical protein